MKVYEFGDPEAQKILLQMVDDHDLEGIEREVQTLSESTSEAFRLIAVKVRDWNYDLSPWKAPAVFGNADFGDGAEDTLKSVLELCQDPGKHYYIGGYSLAGLFALWAAYQTDLFQGVAAASPSIWFPGFTDYMKEHTLLARRVYLSFGDKEPRTRNPIMSTVGQKIEEAHGILIEHGTNCFFEWNRGNHFAEPDIRTAKAFAWVLGEKK